MTAKRPPGSGVVETVSSGFLMRHLASRAEFTGKFANSIHAAPDAVRHGTPTQRALAAEGRRHRQPADGGARRTGQGRTRPRSAAQSDFACGAARVLPLDAPADLPLSRHAEWLAH